MYPPGEEHPRTADVLPELVGRTLLGERVCLPRDLPAETTLVVLAFRQAHQGQADRWIARAAAAGVPATPRGAAQPMRTAVVEVPLLASAWRPARRFIDGGMSSGIGDPDVLARTVTVYTDVRAVRRSLAAEGLDEVLALVVTRSGTVLARSIGEPDEAAWAQVAAGLGLAG